MGRNFVFVCFICSSFLKSSLSDDDDGGGSGGGCDDGGGDDGDDGGGPLVHWSTGPHNNYHQVRPGPE